MSSDSEPASSASEQGSGWCLERGMGRVGKEEDAFGICSLVQGWRQQFRRQGSRLCSQSFWRLPAVELVAGLAQI